VAYKSEDLNSWLQGLMAEQGITGIAGSDANSLSTRYGLGGPNADWDSLAKNLITQGNKNGANLSFSRWQVGGLSDALRNAQNLAQLDAGRGRIGADATGQFDTTLGGANAMGRVADYLSTGSLFNRGDTGSGNVSALGYQELPSAYRTIVDEIGNRYQGDAAVGNYADNTRTEGGFRTLLDSMYGNSVAGQLAGDQLGNAYKSTNQFENYYKGLTGNGWDTSRRFVNNGTTDTTTGGTGGTGQTGPTPEQQQAAYKANTFAEYQARGETPPEWSWPADYAPPASVHTDTGLGSTSDPYRPLTPEEQALLNTRNAEQSKRSGVPIGWVWDGYKWVDPANPGFGIVTGVHF
jgi:hypothetical protein